MLALAGLSGGLGCLLFLLNGRPPSGDTWYTLAFSSFSLVGFVVASRRPRNPIGWLFCTIGLANGLFFFADEYVVHALTVRPGALPGVAWLAWSQNWTVFVMWSLMFFSLMLFPTGRLPSPRWRPVAWALAGVFALVTMLFVVKPGPLEGTKPSVENPTGIGAAAGVVGVVEGAVLPVVLLVVLAAPAAVLVRFWRSRGAERQQLKWLAFAAGLWVGVAALDALNQQVLRSPAVDHATDVLFGAAVAPIPIAVGIAVLKYRLYDIDLIINRTLVYGSLTATLALVYVGGVVGCRPPSGRSPARSPPWPSSPRPSRSRPCSARCVGGCRRWWTSASTGGSTTPPRPLKPSTPGCETRRTWIPSATTWWGWQGAPCNPNTSPCGCAPWRPGRPGGRAREPLFTGVRGREFSEVRMQHPAWMVRPCIEDLPEGILTVKRRPQHPAMSHKHTVCWMIVMRTDVRGMCIR
jgi:hypothetical protein